MDDLVGIAGVTPPQGGSGFGRNAVRFEKKIFAMFVRGRLVVKLPRARVDDLIEAGQGDRFDANKGTPMKEWFSLDPDPPCPGIRSPSRPWSSPARPAEPFSYRPFYLSATWVYLPTITGG